jgi:SAM-dependent methyltransferase
MNTASFIHYLASKKSVDDRALNRRVWDAMVESWRDTVITVSEGPRVLELGGGIGTMVERVIADGRLDPRSWTIIDEQPALMEEARRRLPAMPPFPVSLRAMTLDAYLETAPEPYDLVVANAFLDLLDVPNALPQIARLGRPNGLFFFSITFDGLTSFEPEIDRELDDRIFSLYHRTMDERVTDGQRSGDSRCGRHLLTLLPQCGYRIVEAGASDWIVYPRNGAYPDDEGFFLSCILDFFEESLGARPELEPNVLRSWLAARRRQLADGKLVFLAHQVDVLASRAATAST